MDISGLTSGSAGGFAGFGGTSALPPSVQAKIMNQTQSLNLLPQVSSPGLGASLDIYDAISAQSLGALAGGRSAIELASIKLGIDASQPEEAAKPADAAADKNPPIGATLDNLLKEDGYKPPEDNPYSVRTDFFADRGSLGGLLDSLG